MGIRATYWSEVAWDGMCNTSRFFIDAESGEASTRSAAQDFDQRRFLCPRLLGEISRSGSLGDKSPKHREKTMKIRAIVILLGLAISFALPIFAQEKEDVKPFPFTPIPAGPQLVQQIEAINQQFDEAFNKHDAAAVGDLYTSNAVQMTPQGSFSGREAIEGYITDLFQRHNPSDRVTKMSYVYAFGGDLCALGGWTVTIDGSRQFGGYLAIVYTFVGGTWKIRASVFKYPTS
jgi:uncharacterized protein (TIGR02246 family)